MADVIGGDQLMNDPASERRPRDNLTTVMVHATSSPRVQMRRQTEQESVSRCQADGTVKGREGGPAAGGTASTIAHGEAAPNGSSLMASVAAR